MRILHSLQKHSPGSHGACFPQRAHSMVFPSFAERAAVEATASSEDEDRLVTTATGLAPAQAAVEEDSLPVLPLLHDSEAAGATAAFSRRCCRAEAAEDEREEDEEEAGGGSGGCCCCCCSCCCVGAALPVPQKLTSEARLSCEAD